MVLESDGFTEYLNDSIKLLDVCNGISADIPTLYHNQLMLIRSVCSLLDLSSCSTGVQQDNLCQAKISLQEWLEGTNLGFKMERIDDHLGILQALSTDLELQMGWRSRASSSLGKDNLYQWPPMKALLIP